VSDLLWDDVKQWFNPVENGSAPNLIAEGTTLAHRQLVLDLIRPAPCATNATCWRRRGDAGRVGLV